MKARERITARTDTGRVTYRCEIISETDTILRAHILDPNWDRGGKFDKETGDEIFREWLLEKSLIVKRVPMQQNLTYGTWEPVK